MRHLVPIIIVAAVGPGCLFGPHRARVVESSVLISAGATVALAGAATDCSGDFICLRNEVIGLGAAIAALGAVGLLLSAFDDDAHVAGN